MNPKKKRLLFTMLLFAFMLFCLPAGKTGLKVQAASKRSSLYKKRAKKVKKNLPIKVKKLLKKGYAYPGCKLRYSIRRGHLMLCRLSGSIGEGAYEIQVLVNLKNGRCQILDNMVSIPDTFKVSLK